MVRTLKDLRPIEDDVSKNSVNALPKPNKVQLEFQELEMGLFIHFGMNTFSNEGTGGKGVSSPQLFRPTSLDCNNWMKIAKAMDARYACLTARHEEGFCLWPTTSTDYSVKNSPYKEGKGDVVKEFVEACRNHGIKPCLYHSSLMDSHHIFKEGDPNNWYKEWFHSTNKRLSEEGALEKFTRMQITQIRELLTNYGEITYLWLDHIGETQGILYPELVTKFWLDITDEISRLQPQCMILKADIFLSRDNNIGGGVHGGRAAYPLWHTSRRENSDSGLGDPIPDPEMGDHFISWESNTIFSGNWFWKGNHIKSLKDMKKHYYATVGRGSTFYPILHRINKD
jgi:alpha-L-fucosidase